MVFWAVFSIATHSRRFLRKSAPVFVYDQAVYRGMQQDNLLVLLSFPFSQHSTIKLTNKTARKRDQSLKPSSFLSKQVLTFLECLILSFFLGVLIRKIKHNSQQPTAAHRTRSPKLCGGDKCGKNMINNINLNALNFLSGLEKLTVIEPLTIVI